MLTKWGLNAGFWFSPSSLFFKGLKMWFRFPLAEEEPSFETKYGTTKSLGDYRDIWEAQLGGVLRDTCTVKIGGKATSRKGWSLKISSLPLQIAQKACQVVREGLKTVFLKDPFAPIVLHILQYMPFSSFAKMLAQLWKKLLLPWKKLLSRLDKEVISLVLFLVILKLHYFELVSFKEMQHHLWPLNFQPE